MNKNNINLKLLTLLYVEDEDAIRENLSNVFSMIFKDILVASNAEDGLELYNNSHVDIILSDIGLPKMSGIDMVKIIRETNINIPIVLLTAYTDTKILIEAVKLNLIDYLVKPINFTELQNTFNKISTALENENHSVMLSNILTYDMNKKVLLENDIDLHITASESKLLELFINNRHRSLSVEEIKNNVWDDCYGATDSAFKSLLNKLRKRIGTDMIVNNHGIGYHLVLTDTK